MPATHEIRADYDPQTLVVYQVATILAFMALRSRNSWSRG